MDSPRNYGAPEECPDADILQAYQDQNTTVEPGFRWIKNPAAISPVWLEKPERIAALAMLTVLGLLVYSVIQRQVRLYLRTHDQQIPGNKGMTATPTAAVGLALFAQVFMIQLGVDDQQVEQMYGVQSYHLRLCDALGLDSSWYGVPSAQKTEGAFRPLERGSERPFFARPCWRGPGTSWNPRPCCLQPHRLHRSPGQAHRLHNAQTW